MRDINRRLKSLTDACQSTVQQLSNLEVFDVQLKVDQNEMGVYPLAHVINYRQIAHQLNGEMILAFADENDALRLASAIGEQLGASEFTAHNNDATDTLNDFIKIVFGKTISEWNKLGASTEFDLPFFKKDYKYNFQNKSAKSYLIKLSAKPGKSISGAGPDFSSVKILLRLSFSESVKAQLLNKKILIVDDSKTMRGLITKSLNEHGANTQEAASGIEAIRVFKSFLPDITLMDINMPGMDGFHTIEMIRKFSPQSKFIILSSISQKEEIYKAKNLDVDAYLIKPPNWKELINRVSESLTST